MGVAHDVAIYAPGAIIWESALPPNAGVGEVVGFANEQRTWFEVKLDGEKETKVFTVDELVKVATDA